MPAPTLDELRDLAVIDIPTAGRLLDLSRSAAYRAAASGHLPTIAVGDRRRLVPVPLLLRLLEGAPQATHEVAS